MSRNTSSNASGATGQQMARRANKKDLDQIAEALGFGFQPRRTLANNRKFKLEQATQGRSRLLDMPMEVQLNIFERLLKNDEPLRIGIDHTDASRSVSTNTNPPVPTSTNFDLDPQVLACCQHIYRNFIDIFNHENSMEISVMPDTLCYQRPVIMIMGTVYEPDNYNRYGIHDIAGDCEGPPDHVKSFKKFHIRIEDRPRHNFTGPMPPLHMYALLPKISRGLLVLLFGKEVTLELKNDATWDADTCGDELAESINELRMLRCSSFTLTSNKITAGSRQLARTTEATIMGREPPIDIAMLHDAAKEFFRVFQTRFLQRLNPDGLKFRAEVARMDAAASNWDYDEFEDARSAAMRIARRKMRELEVLEEEANACMPEADTVVTRL